MIKTDLNKSQTITPCMQPTIHNTQHTIYYCLDASLIMNFRKNWLFILELRIACSVNDTGRGRLIKSDLLVLIFPIYSDL